MVANFKKIASVKKEADSWLLKIPGVTGVAVGLKEVNKEPVPGPLAIVVFVENKKDKAALSPAELIPTEIGGIKTDVVQRGKVYLMENINVSGQEVESDANKAGGTLGCFAKVVSGEHNGENYTTNQSHVLFNGEEKGPPYGDKVGNICSICSPCCSTYIGKTLDAELNDKMDASIAELTPGVKYNPQVKDLWPIKGVHTFVPNDLVAHLAVKKYGKTTEETHGILDHALWSGPIYNHGGQLHMTFHLQFSIKAVVTGPGNPVFTEGGDSGAIVLLDDNTILGLLMAGTKDPNATNIAIVCPIKPIIDRFHLEIETSNNLGDTRCTWNATCYCTNTIINSRRRYCTCGEV